MTNQETEELLRAGFYKEPKTLADGDDYEIALCEAGAKQKAEMPIFAAMCEAELFAAARGLRVKFKSNTEK